MKVLSIATLDIPEAMLRLLKQTTSVDLRSWSIAHASFCTFLAALVALVTSLGPGLGGGLWSQRLSWESLIQIVTHHFIKGIMKMADDDINPFSNHNKTNAQPDETIPLTPGGVIEGASTWEPE